MANGHRRAQDQGSQENRSANLLIKSSNKAMGKTEWNGVEWWRKRGAKSQFTEITMNRSLTTCALLRTGCDPINRRQGRASEPVRSRAEFIYNLFLSSQLLFAGCPHFEHTSIDRSMSCLAGSGRTCPIWHLIEYPCLLACLDGWWVGWMRTSLAWEKKKVDQQQQHDRTLSASVASTYPTGRLWRTRRCTLSVFDLICTPNIYLFNVQASSRAARMRQNGLTRTQLRPTNQPMPIQANNSPRARRQEHPTEY